MPDDSATDLYIMLSKRGLKLRVEAIDARPGLPDDLLLMVDRGGQVLSQEDREALPRHKWALIRMQLHQEMVTAEAAAAHARRLRKLADALEAATLG